MERPVHHTVAMSVHATESITDSKTAEFGFYPKRLDLKTDSFSLDTLSGHDSASKYIKDHPNVENGWFYSELQETYDLRGHVITKPYRGRVFCMPKTHKLVLNGPYSENDVCFVIWCLSFFTGMRLTSTQAGFLDATPVKPGTLVDFCLSGSNESGAIQLALNFLNKEDRQVTTCMRLAAVIHALFLSQNPKNLHFEKFQYLYMALDGCFSIIWDERDKTKKIKKPLHSERVYWMCDTLGMPIPFWADGKDNIAAVRNENFHEAIFFGQPLGFSAYGSEQSGTVRNAILLQMEALICRYLVALLGGTDTSYINSPLNTREYFPLKLK